jgi:hypothetical protein
MRDCRTKRRISEGDPRQLNQEATAVDLSEINDLIGVLSNLLHARDDIGKLGHALLVAAMRRVTELTSSNNIVTEILHGRLPELGGG